MFLYKYRILVYDIKNMYIIVGSTYCKLNTEIFENILLSVEQYVQLDIGLLVNF